MEKIRIQAHTRKETSRWPTKQRRKWSFTNITFYHYSNELNLKNIRSNTQHLCQCFHYLVQSLMLIIYIDRVKINSLLKWWQLTNSYLLNILCIVSWYQHFDSLQQRNISTNSYQFIVIKIIMWSILFFLFVFFCFFVYFCFYQPLQSLVSLC